METSNAGRSLLRTILAGLASSLTWIGYLHWTDPHGPGSPADDESWADDFVIHPLDRW
ncbi:hypothetical protein [Sphaerisporangium corydalis]|uniref:Uncharacterized protein n=1 Tax=Sphaerisporangium corydalis TaxID=1441875 RepID=A0ABV9EIC3_9ACTN|nr:hypothetical protein [Sphaerisporangium corydalis]